MSCIKKDNAKAYMQMNGVMLCNDTHEAVFTYVKILPFSHPKKKTT